MQQRRPLTEPNTRAKSCAFTILGVPLACPNLRRTMSVNSRITRIGTAVGAGLILIALAGCNAPGSGGSSGQPGSSASQAEKPGPLAPYANSLAGIQTPKQYFAQAERIQNSIAACMHGEGFTYLPVDTAKLVSYGQATSHPDTAQWAATWGYGINKAPAAATSGAVDRDYVNPNDAVVSRLSASEQAAYNAALNGSGGSQGTANSDTVSGTRSDSSGCQGAAEKANPEKDPSSDKQFADLVAQSNRIPGKVASSAKVVALDADWASCMADAGDAKYASPAKAQQAIEERYNAYYLKVKGTPDPSVVESMSKTEIETASADFVCRQKVDYANRHSAVEDAAEQQFVDDNKKGLDALLASYGLSGK
jgi:hypothetical protein